MVADILNAIFKFLKLAPRYLIAVVLFAGIMLFSPDRVLQRLGVLRFAQDNRSWLGIAFLGATSLFVVSCIIDLINWLKRSRRERARTKHIVKRLNNLTEDEKQILRFYLANNTRANRLRYDDGVVRGLEADGIIHRSSSLGNLVEGFPYNISDVAWNYLHLNPDLLMGTTNTYRTDKRSWL
jgi:hypothetical protein